jgi:hypothetical protein
MTILCLPGGSVTCIAKDFNGRHGRFIQGASFKGTFFWANILILFRTTSIPLSSLAFSSSTCSSKSNEQRGIEVMDAGQGGQGEGEKRTASLLLSPNSCMQNVIVGRKGWSTAWSHLRCQRVDAGRLSGSRRPGEDEVWHVACDGDR